MNADEAKALAKKYTRQPKVIEKNDGIMWMLCPVCGRKFSKVINTPWAYKISNCYFDRYSCMREAEDIIEKSKKRRGRKSGNNNDH